jgi:hypothetical protein
MQIRAIIATAFASILLTTTLHAADLTIIVKQTDQEHTGTSRMHLAKGHVRIEQDEAAAGKHILIFDAAKQTIWVLNMNDKIYMEITKEDMAQVRTQMDAAIVAMRERLKDLPPEQRQQAEEMMQQLGGGMTPGAAPLQYRKVGTDRVVRWSCDKYESYQNNQKRREACTIAPEQLGLTAQDFEAFQRFAAAASSMSPMGAGPLAGLPTKADSSLAGFPLRMRFFADGQAAFSWEVTDVQRETLPAAAFQVPADFRKEPLGQPGHQP